MDVYIACWLQPAQATQLALVDGEPVDALHVTLLCLNADVGMDPEWLRRVAENALDAEALRSAPLTGAVSGLGVFVGEDADVLYGSVDAPGLTDLRQRLVARLTSEGIQIDRTHDFTPHVTLAYLEPGTPVDLADWEPVAITLDSAAATIFGADVGDRVDVVLSGVEKEGPTAGESHVDVPLGSSGKTNRRRPKPDEEPQEVHVAKLDKARQLVYGVVLEPHVEDSQDDWETPDDIEKAAHRFLYNQVPLGLQHRALAPKSVRPVESFIAPCDFAYPESPDDVVTKGSWVVVAHVNDDMIWKATKNGLFNGWSIAGRGKRTDEPLDAPVRKDVFDDETREALDDAGRRIDKAVDGLVAAASREHPAPIIHVHMPGTDAPVVNNHVTVPEREHHTHVEIPAAEVHNHIEVPKPVAIKVETAEDGSRRYVPET
jgi:2'-5' RNA ligase